MHFDVILFFFCLGFAIEAAGTAPPESWITVARALPSSEVRILLTVGRKYALQGDALKLLFVIRKIENGGPGYEMGVDVPAARRHADDPAKSLFIQASWSAGTIRRGYTGDMAAFARRYCPLNAENWERMARCWMDKT